MYSLIFINIISRRCLAQKRPGFEKVFKKIITFLEFFLFGEVVAFWSVALRVGGFDWLVAEAEAAIPTLQVVCKDDELDNDILPPPPGDVGGKLLDDILFVFRKFVLLYGIWKFLSS